MDIFTGFLIYVVLYRLAIIAAGVVSVVLGYRLFIRGVMPEGTTSVDGKIGEVRLTVKNAAPGTCFALFGVIIISVMVLEGSPELVLDSLGSANMEQERHIRLKGATPSEATSPATSGAFQDRRKWATIDMRAEEHASAIRELERALLVPGVSLQESSTALNDLAWLYAQSGRASEARGLARIAVGLQPKNAAFQDTLSSVELALGNKREAVLHGCLAVQAAQSTSAYQQTLRAAIEEFGDENLDTKTELESLDAACVTAVEILRREP